MKDTNREDDALSRIHDAFPSTLPEATPLLQLFSQLQRRLTRDPFPVQDDLNVETGNIGLDLLLGGLSRRDSVLITGVDPTEVRELALSFVAYQFAAFPTPILYISLRETALQACEQLARISINAAAPVREQWGQLIEKMVGSSGNGIEGLSRIYFYDHRPIDVARCIREFRPDLQLNCIVIDDAATLRAMIPLQKFNDQWDAIRLAAAERKTPLLTIGGMAKGSQNRESPRSNVAYEDFPIDRLSVLIHLERAVGKERRIVVFKPGEPHFGVIPLYRSPNGRFSCGVWNEED